MVAGEAQLWFVWGLVAVALDCRHQHTDREKDTFEDKDNPKFLKFGPI